MPDLPAFRPHAVVFDLDGTLTDNLPWHARAFEAFTRRHRLPPMTMEMRRRLDGKRNDEVMPVLFGRMLSDEEQRVLADEKESLYRDVAKGHLRPMPGLPALLDVLEARAIPVALATSAPQENVAYTLREIGLADRIATIARGDEVPNGKPAPDVFLLAARLLGADPAMCLAFEDAPVGVEAAVRAGMRCVAITSSFSPAVFAESACPAHAIYPDYVCFLEGEGEWLLSTDAVAGAVGPAR
jgi:beta-phosphoglucomutase